MDTTARAKASELLLAAAVMAEDGERLEEMLETIRAAYYEMKPRW